MERKARNACPKVRCCGVYSENVGASSAIFFGLQRITVRIDQLRRARAAQNARSGHAFVRSNCAGKGSAIGVRILPHLRAGALHRGNHRRRRTEGVDVRRKIEPDLHAVDIAAVRVLRFI